MIKCQKASFIETFDLYCNLPQNKQDILAKNASPKNHLQSDENTSIFGAQKLFETIHG